MADVYKVLYQGELPTVAAAIYTVPALTEAIIKHIDVVCTEADSISLFVGGVSIQTNIILPTVDMVIGEFAQWDGTLTLEAAQTIGGVAGVSATSITVTIYGDEVS